MSATELKANKIAAELRKAQAELATAQQKAADANAEVEVRQIDVDHWQRELNKLPSSTKDFENEIEIVAGTILPKSGKTGFREAIRETLSEHRGVKISSRDMWGWLQGKGVSYDGSVDPVTRTGNELRSLARNGEVMKEGRYFFSVPVSRVKHG